MMPRGSGFGCNWQIAILVAICLGFWALVYLIVSWIVEF